MDFAESIKQKALKLGFDAVGITTAEPIDPEQVKYLKNWIIAGCAAQMDYINKNLDKRINPAELLPRAQSVICVALNYRPKTLPDIPHRINHGRIANFALYEDYHKFIKKGLRRLVDFIKDTSGSDNGKFKICVDSAPLAERALAQRAGLGFIGKNHMLIHPQLGLQILLGEIVTDLKLTPDEPISKKCSGCDECIRKCPTGALAPDGSFDAVKCISYLTIEHKGKIPDSLVGKIGVRLFGCDECIIACPLENNAPVCGNKQFKISPENKWLDSAEILKWDSERFDEYFKNSTVRRLGLERLKRNANICLKNAVSNYGARKMSSSS